MRRLLITFLCLLFAVVGAEAAAPDAAPDEIGFLVAAPDRGFLGNEEIRDLFEVFAERHNAALVFVTDERTGETAEAALAELAARGARRAVALPLFLSAAERRYATLQRALEAVRGVPVSWARPFGASYFAVEAVADRLRALPPGAGRRLVLAGSGAGDAEAAARIAAELSRIGGQAAEGLGYGAIGAAVWPERGADGEEALAAAARSRMREDAGAVVVPLHLARKLDSMMTFAHTLRGAVPAGSELLEEAPLTPLALTWMEREANRALPWRAEEIGVIVAAHGSDWHWNQAMRDAARPLEARHPVAFAFSMADPPVIERAVRRLERRGVRAIVVVRVFGLGDSFEPEILRMIGADVEGAQGEPAAGEERHADADADAAPPDGHERHQHGAHGHGSHGHGSHGHGSHGHGSHGHGSHGHGSHGGPAPRIRSAAVLLSAGGLDDHPLFAEALLDRAKALSTDPRHETVILTAHGTDDDERNARWLDVLESLAAQMRAAGGDAFRAIRVGTWREDWPDKRATWVPRIRGWVEEAGQGGTAIVVPARTNGAGPEARLLAGLDYRLGSGFVPHPLFARWLGEQVERAVAGRDVAAGVPHAAHPRVDR